MKVNDAYRVSLAAAHRARRRSRTDGVVETDAAAPLTDQVILTERSGEVRRARSLALNAPEVRVALVDSISDQISRGEYVVTGADVAPKLIQDHLAIARA